MFFLLKKNVLLPLLVLKLQLNLTPRFLLLQGSHVISETCAALSDKASPHTAVTIAAPQTPTEKLKKEKYIQQSTFS